MTYEKLKVTKNVLVIKSRFPTDHLWAKQLE